MTEQKTEHSNRQPSAVQARQGVRGRPALYVLVASLALMALYMVGLLTWSGTSSPPSQAQQASRAEVTGSTDGQSERVSSANSAHVPAGNPAYPEPAVPRTDGAPVKQP